MSIDRDTACYISIAERPGNFGATIFNAVFEELHLNCIYKPFRVGAEDLNDAIRGLRAFGIRGCGVSMPHKMSVMQYLDKIDNAAKRIGAVNTIVNTDGVLTGYNTDYEGAKRALCEVYDMQGKSALIIGAGGAARAIIVALKDSGAQTIWVTNRDEYKGKDLANEFSIGYYPFAERSTLKADLLVNATPVGMPPNTHETIIDTQAFVHYDVGMDVVVSAQKTAFIRTLESQKKKVIPGSTMALYQGIVQYELYTGQTAPMGIINKSIQKYFGA